MASITVNFEANAATITLLGGHKGSGQTEHSNTTDHADAIVRAVAQEWAQNSTATGTVTITAS